MSSPQETGVSSAARLTALLQILVMIALFWIVRDYARDREMIGAGSMGVVAAVIAGSIMMWLRGGRWRTLGFRMPKTKSEKLAIPLIALAILVTIFLVLPNVIVPVIQKLFDNPNMDTASDHFSFFYGKPDVFLIYLLTVVWIGAAFGEELLFRGLIMDHFAEIFGRSKFAWGLAAIAQAVLFGAGHAYQGMVGVIVTGSVGFIFGVFYLVGRRNLLPLIFAHGLIDTMSLAQLYAANSGA